MRVIDAAAKALNLTDYIDRRPGQLSGGQRQRVAIGRAVVREPKVFLFDEPLSNLDAELRVSMRREIGALHRRLGNTMIYVTHDQVEAMTMADKIAVLRAGKVEQFGTPLDLFNRPKNRFVAGFIGSPAMNFLQGKTGPQGIVLDDKTVISVDPARMKGLDGTAVELGARPRDMVIDPNGAMHVRILEVEQLGTESYLFAELSTGESIVIHQPGQTTAKIGDKLRISINADALFLFDKVSGQAWY